jgi:cobalt-zinc-cadmium resistance protein CzcA
LNRRRHGRDHEGGGKTKTYDVAVDLDRLKAHGLALSQVLDALNNGNGNVGAQTIDFRPQSAVVRGIGQFRWSRSATRC